MSHKSPSQYLRGTHERIAAVLDGPKTAAELAQILGLPYEAIASTLRGMHARKEVAKLKAQPGKPYRWKLKEQAA